MPANTSPIWIETANVAWCKLNTGNTATDGTGTVGTCFTADATDGSYVEKIIAKALGTNVATVLRIFVNNGSTTGTATNNSLIREVSLPATTASNNTAIYADVEIPLGIRLPASYTITACVGTTVSAGWQITGIGGNY